MATANPFVPKYEFFAVLDDKRMPMRVDSVCETYAQAASIAVDLATGIIGVEVRRAGSVVHFAPRRPLLVCRGEGWSDG